MTAFKNDFHEIIFSDRLKFVNKKDGVPVDLETLHKPLGESGEKINIPSDVTV